MLCVRPFILFPWIATVLPLLTVRGTSLVVLRVISILIQRIVVIV